jgi:hypothetical protein
MQGRVSGVAWKDANIGAAAESNCVMGLSPRINSMVRNMLLVEYMVESVVPRRTYGLMTKATVRCAST